MENKYVLLIGVACLAGGALIQRQWDGKQTTSVVTKGQDIIHNQIVTRTVVVHTADGTTTSDTTTTDTSIKKSIEESIAKTSTPVLSPQWLISAGTSLDTNRTQFYTVQVQRAILGPIFVGIYGTTHKELGVSLGVLF